MSEPEPCRHAPLEMEAVRSLALRHLERSNPGTAHGEQDWRVVARRCVYVIEIPLVYIDGKPASLDSLAPSAMLVVTRDGRVY